MGNRKDWLTLTPRPARPADRRADGRRLGEPVVVENRAGAGGNVGTALVARARGDAHTLLVGSSGPLAISPITETQLGYDPLADLTPITLLNTTPLVLVVRSASPSRTCRGWWRSSGRMGGRCSIRPRRRLAAAAGAGGLPSGGRLSGGAGALPRQRAGDAGGDRRGVSFTIENLVLVAPHLAGPYGRWG
ncbi:Bug family tripartite tricarboxylate transporter substrate binding protein [Siccirubricoccus deserti]